MTTMAGPDESRSVDDTVADTPSPNPRNKKKSKDDDNTEETKPMDVDETSKFLFENSNDDDNEINNNTSFQSDDNDNDDDLRAIWLQEIKDPTEYWTNYTEFPNATAFELNDNNNKIQEHMMAVYSFVEDRDLITVRDWAQIFADVFGSDPSDRDNATEVRFFTTCMALSDLVTLFGTDKWQNGQLRPDNVTNHWIAVYTLFGAPWKNRQQWFTTSPQDETCLLYTSDAADE